MRPDALTEMYATTLIQLRMSSHGSGGDVSRSAFTHCSLPDA